VSETVSRSPTRTVPIASPQVGGRVVNIPRDPIGVNSGRTVSL